MECTLLCCNVSTSISVLLLQIIMRNSSMVVYVEMYSSKSVAHTRLSSLAARPLSALLAAMRPRGKPMRPAHAERV